MSTVLFTNPSHDEATKVLSAWIDSVAEYINTSGSISHNAVGLSSDEVTKTNFITKCGECSPRLVMINGHGNAATLCGHNDQPIIEEGDGDHPHLSQVIVHALACAAGKSLGIKLVGSGTETFIGYNEDFHFYHDLKPGDDPTKDPLTSLFLEPAYAIPKLLADGLTAQEAFNESQKMSQQNLLMALKTNIDQPILASLYHNFKSHTLIGSQTSVL